MAIRAITFDFWCTLFRDANGRERQWIRTNALAEAARVPTYAAEEALAQIAEAFMRTHIEEQRNLTPVDAVRLATEHLGVKMGPQQTKYLSEVFATAILHHSPVPIDGALDAVIAASTHLPLAVISDSGMSPGTSLRVLLERHGFSPYFNVLTFSDEVGVSKPQAIMFERTAKALRVEPSELLHIGDLEPTDIVGAQAVGAKAALFVADNNRHLDGTQADWVFNSWAEFAEALPGLLDG